MGYLDLNIEDSCPNCDHDLDFRVEFRLHDAYDSDNQTVSVTCENCKAALSIKCSCDLDCSFKYTVVSKPTPLSEIEDDQPYHSNDPNQISLL